MRSVNHPPGTRAAGHRTVGPALTRVAAAILGGVAILGAYPAAATESVTPCAARAVLLDRLASNFHEAPVSLGITANGSLLEVLTSPEGSWTILVTVPGGPTCLVSAGDGWRGAPVQIAEDPGV